MLCLANTEAVREVVFGPGVSLSKAGLGRCWWIFSSLEPTATREMAAELKRVAVCVGSMLRCPGGTPGAQQGSLVIMAGGRLPTSSGAPVLAHLGQRLTRMGDVGAGQVTKCVTR
jgi:3-hydroxyisobutyrate dehydrogenase